MLVLGAATAATTTRTAAAAAVGPFCLLSSLAIQVGLYEMKVMPEKTGGAVVMADSFSLNVYKDSLRKFFETDSTGEAAASWQAS